MFIPEKLFIKDYYFEIPTDYIGTIYLRHQTICILMQGGSVGGLSPLVFKNVKLKLISIASETT